MQQIFNEKCYKMKSNKFPVIDFRNGRYQGATKSHLPHGVGFFIDKNFMLCLAEWVAGEISGNAIVIFPSGRVFYGEVRFANPENIYAYELTEDHVQLITFTKSKRQRNTQEMLAAVLPLLRIILQIDNSDPQNAKVLRQYEFSQASQEQNISAINRILNLDRNGLKSLKSYTNFIQYFKDKFLDVYPETLEFNIQQRQGKRQYFMGLRGEGLGVKVEPIEQLTLNKKKTGKVYIVRAMGYFTKENQLKDIGIKTHNNLMKGIIYEEAIFSVPQTSIKYEPGKRPLNCSINFHNYIKRSLYYRDKVLETQYIYDLERRVEGFNQNLRKTQTERLAQKIIQTPNSHPMVLAQIEEQRRMKEANISKAKEEVNPYHPNFLESRDHNPQYALLKAKDEIYRSATKKKNVSPQAKVNYKKVQYQDPNYRKMNQDELFKPIKQVLAYPSMPNHPPLEPSNRLYEPSIKKRSISPYRYIPQLQQPQSAYKENPYPSTEYLSPKRLSKYPKYFPTDRPSHKSPPFLQVNRIPYTPQPYNRAVQSNLARYKKQRPLGLRPRYDYLFNEDQQKARPTYSER